MKGFIAVLTLTLLLLAIILPSVLTRVPEGSVTAFNRDATSGTREAFVEKALEPEGKGDGLTTKTWTPGSNVREVRNNDAMITFVKRQTNSIGYVSFGTIADFDKDGNPVMKKTANKNVSFATFDGILPTKDNILNNNYEAARNFNLFFRAKKDSSEYEVTKYNFEDDSFSGDVTKLDNIKNKDDLEASYLFYNWVLHSSEATDVIDKGYDADEPTGEISMPGVKYDFGKDKVDSYINTIGINKNKEQYMIEIVGSTSATALMTELMKEFDKDISNYYGLSENRLKLQLATNGSGDAFKATVSGTDRPFIGMQSREAQDNELSNWGYESVDASTYNPFAKDAILIIYNNNGVPLAKDEYLNIDSQSIYDLYTNYEYYTYEDIFKVMDKDGNLKPLEVI